MTDTVLTADARAEFAGPAGAPGPMPFDPLWVNDSDRPTPRGVEERVPLVTHTPGAEITPLASWRGRAVHLVVSESSDRYDEGPLLGELGRVAELVTTIRGVTGREVLVHHVDVTSPRQTPAVSDIDGRRLFVQPGLFDRRVEMRLWQDAASDHARSRASVTASADLGVPAPLADEQGAQEGIGWEIEGLLPVGGSLLVIGPRKSGKTQLRNELVAALASGEPLLGRWTVHTPNARVLVIDAEMIRGQAAHWLHETVPDAHVSLVDLWSIKGAAAGLAVTVPAVRARVAEILRPYDVVVLDCLRPVLDALGISESRDAGAFLEAWDETLRLAGSPTSILVHHTGHAGGHARGDSRIEDWADTIMTIAVGKTGARRVSAVGRDVLIDPVVVSYDAATRRLSDEQTAAATALPAEEPEQTPDPLDTITSPMLYTRAVWLRWLRDLAADIDTGARGHPLKTPSVNHIYETVRRVRRVTRGDVVDALNDLIREGVVIEIAQGPARLLDPDPDHRALRSLP